MGQMVNRRSTRLNLRPIFAVAVTMMAGAAAVSANGHNRATPTRHSSSSRPSRPAPSMPPRTEAARELYAALPLGFEADVRRDTLRTDFVTRGPGYSVRLEGTDLILNGRSSFLRMSLLGANRNAGAEALDRLPGSRNYFIGRDPRKWRTDVPTYARVHYRDVYPGIDLVYYGNQHQLEYDFVVAPGTDPGAIEIALDGIDGARVESGDLAIDAGGGSIRMRKPAVYQQVDGNRREIEGEYVLTSPRRVRFRLDRYDAAAPLIIDPIVLYSTFLGGSGADAGNAVAVDGAGNAYVAGATRSTDLPEGAVPFKVGPGGTNGSASPGGDIFVAKIDTTKSGAASLVYSTVIGGSGNDSAFGIAVDGFGSAYLTGQAGWGSSDFPTTPGAFQPSSITGRFFFPSAFVLKLSPAGDRLDYSTFFSFPFDTDSIGASIAIDSFGDAYILGTFPTSNGPFATQPQCDGLAKFDPFGANLIYAFGLPSCRTQLAVDSSGNVHLAGDAVDPNLGTFGHSPGISMIELDSAGNFLTSAILGSPGEQIAGLGLDDAGNMYVARRLFNQPVSTTIVSRLGALPYNTTLAFDAFAPQDVPPHNLAVDRRAHTAVIFGSDAISGSPEVVQLDSAGAVASSFPLPVSGTRSIAAESGAAYLTGSAIAGFPTAPSAFDSTCGTPAGPCAFDRPDAFLMKVGGASAGLGVTLIASPDPVIVGHQATFTTTVTNAGPSTATGVTITITVPAAATLVSAVVQPGAAVCTGAGAGTIVCPVGSLGVGITATANLIVTAGGGLMTATATVKGNEPDPDLTNNSASASVTGEKRADISLNVVASTPTVTPGMPGRDTVTFTATIQNLGDFQASGVEFHAILPYVLLTGNPGDVVPSTCTTTVGSLGAPTFVDCNSLGAMAVGASTTVVITARAQLTVFAGFGPAAVSARAGNTAPPGATFEIDPDFTNNDATSTVQVVNTPTGNVTVEPTDPANSTTTPGSSRITLTFQNVTQPGTTTETRLPSAPTPPAGFQVVSPPPAFYEINTTAQFSGPVRVCIGYVTGISPRLFHYEQVPAQPAGVLGWVDKTLFVDAVNQIVCGDVTSLSPFALFEPANQPPVAKAKSITVGAGPSCNATISPSALDAGSFDPDGDPISLSLDSTGPFILGPHTVVLTATDSHGATSSAAAIVTVIDITPPTVSAALAPIETHKRQGEFRVTYTVADACDPAPAVAAVMALPQGAGAFAVTFEKSDDSNDESTMVFDFEKRRIHLEGQDESALRSLLATVLAAGGAPVGSGQIVRLASASGEGHASRFEFRFAGTMLVAERAPLLELRVATRDVAGNAAVGTASPTFNTSR